MIRTDFRESSLAAELQLDRYRPPKIADLRPHPYLSHTSCGIFRQTCRLPNTLPARSRMPRHVSASSPPASGSRYAPSAPLFAPHRRSVCGLDNPIRPVGNGRVVYHANDLLHRRQQDDVGYGNDSCNIGPFLARNRVLMRKIVDPRCRIRMLGFNPARPENV